MAADCTVEHLPYSIDCLFSRVHWALEAFDLRLQRRLLSGDAIKLASLCSTYCDTIGVDPAVEAPAPPEGFTRQLFARRASNLMLRLVRFAKKTAEFIALPLWAQIRLLRASAMSCILLRSAELLDLEQARWGNDGMSLDVLKHVSDVDGGDDSESTASTAATAVDFYSDHFALTAGVRRLVPAAAGNAGLEQDEDRVLFALLQLIVLLSPEALCLNTSAASEGDAVANCCSFVSDAQQLYTSLLLRHLQAAYCYRHGDDALPGLLVQLGVLKQSSRRQIRGFRSCAAIRDDPLLKELFGP